MTTPTSSIAAAAVRKLAPASMVNGRYVDDVTGRPAYYGPNGQPGTATMSGQYTQAYKMPDGRTAYYNPNSFGYSDPSRPANVPQVSAKPLQASNMAAVSGTALPFDADAADAQAQLQAQKNRFESDAVSEQERINREHVNLSRQVQEQKPVAQRNLLENYAGRGLAYSSGYAYDQTDQESQFAKMLAELDQGKTAGMADLLRQRGLFNDEWSQRLQAIQAAAARRLAEQAGDLGLGGGAGGGTGGGAPGAGGAPVGGGGDYGMEGGYANQQPPAPQQPAGYADGKAVLSGGRFLDLGTGRPAYYGPQGQAGYAAAQRQPGMQQAVMPDGRVVYYWG